MAVMSPAPAPQVAARRLRKQPLAAVARPRRLDVDRLAYRWESALDAAQRALNAESHVLPGAELHVRSANLVRERQEIAATLATLARIAGVRPTLWPDSRR